MMTRSSRTTSTIGVTLIPTIPTRPPRPCITEAISSSLGDARETVAIVVAFRGRLGRRDGLAIPDRVSPQRGVGQQMRREELRQRNGVRLDVTDALLDDVVRDDRG